MLASEDLTISFCNLLRALRVSTQPLSRVMRKRRIRAASPKPIVGVNSLVMKRVMGLEASETRPYLTAQADNCLLISAPDGPAAGTGASGAVGAVMVAGALGCFW